MSKWEYIVFRTYGPEGIVTHVNSREISQDQAFTAEGLRLYKFLNQMGKNGWELVGFHSTNEGVLKRPLGMTMGLEGRTR
jgi:hypothetical protein